VRLAPSPSNAARTIVVLDRSRVPLALGSNLLALKRTELNCISIDTSADPQAALIIFTSSKRFSNHKRSAYQMRSGWSSRSQFTESGRLHPEWRRKLERFFSNAKTLP